jgi:eukaryotic-like serine/threonine-protein kinase
MLDADHVRVHLADFGIARFSDTTRMTATGACIGTPAYLAPEQLEGHAGPASDVYSLGLVIIECLTGTRCYPGTLAETTFARLHQAPTIPNDLPPWLHHTLQAMTARHPNRRPAAQATAAAFNHRTVDAVLATTSDLAVPARSPNAEPSNEPEMATTFQHRQEGRLTA